MSGKTSKVKTLSNLEACECKWPIGDPRHADFHFCGASQVPGRPYCELHWRMSFVPAKSRHQAPVVHTIQIEPVSVPALPNQKAA